jgi:hypothetical protein
VSLNLTTNRQSGVQRTTIRICLETDRGRFRQIVRQVESYALSYITGGQVVIDNIADCTLAKANHERQS